MIVKALINGEKIEKDVDPNKRLLDFLREDMKLTSVKEGCGEGECGACTVILDGKAVTSCTVFTGQIQGCEVVTLEGLDKSGELDKIRDSFIKKVLVGKKFSKEILPVLLEKSSMQVDEAIPTRTSRYYKRIAVKGLVDNILNDLIEQEQSLEGDLYE